MMAKERVKIERLMAAMMKELLCNGKVRTLMIVAVLTLLSALLSTSVNHSASIVMGIFTRASLAPCIHY